MRKTSAVISLVCTIIIILSGIIVYSEGGDVDWFGITISPGVFVGIVVVFVIYDIYAMKSAFSAEKKIAASETAIQARTMEKNAIDGALSAPCTVTFTRIACTYGCATGIQVYLNGTPMTVVKNGETISMTTFVKHNELGVHYNANNSSRSIQFVAVPGGIVHIDLKFIGAKLSVSYPMNPAYPVNPSNPAAPGPGGSAL